MSMYLLKWSMMFAGLALTYLEILNAIGAQAIQIREEWHTSWEACSY